LNVLLEIVLINLKITHLPTYLQKNAEQLITVYYVGNFQHLKHKTTGT
jgi:hypothetical protein